MIVMVSLSPHQRLLYGAIAGAALPFILHSGVSAFVSAKVAALAKVIMSSLFAPATTKAGFNLTTCFVWSVIGAGFGLAFGNFLDGDGKHKCGYAVVMTALIAAFCIGVMINFSMALMTFFAVMTYGYAAVQHLDSLGFFSFHAIEPSVTFKQLPGTDKLVEKIDMMRQFMRPCQALRILFMGPPGTGKTSIAHAIADRYGKKVIIVTSSDLHAADPMHTKLRIQRLFAEAVIQGGAKGSAVVILEEIDGVARDRQTASEQRNDEITELMQILQSLDKIPSDLIIIGTTNFTKLDPGATREGRWDITEEVNLPNREQRAKIISGYSKSLKIQQTSEYFDPDRMEGWSGAHIAALMKTAAKYPAGIKSKYEDIQRNIQRVRDSQSPSFENQGRAQGASNPPTISQHQKMKELLKQMMAVLSFSPAEIAANSMNPAIKEVQAAVAAAASI